MRQKVLKTKAVYKAQTGPVVVEEIGEILQEFGIMDKVVAVTVDNVEKNLNIQPFFFKHHFGIETGNR